MQFFLKDYGNIDDSLKKMHHVSDIKRFPMPGDILDFYALDDHDEKIRFAPPIKCTGTQLITIKWHKEITEFPEIIIDKKSLNTAQEDNFLINEGYQSKEDFYKEHPKTTAKVLVHWRGLKY